MGFPQRIHDVVFESFSWVMSECVLYVERDALHIGVPGFGRSFVMSDLRDVFPQTFGHLGLVDPFPRLPGLIG